MAESESVFAFAADGFANQIATAAPGLAVHDFDDGPLRGAEPQAPTWIDPEATLLIVYTSGTTGTPRGAMLSQRAVRATALHGLHLHDLTSSDPSLCFLSMFHVGGLNIQCLPTLYAGGTVILLRRFDPSETRQPRQGTSTSSAPNANDQTVDRGLNHETETMFIGSPASIKDKLNRQIEATGVNYFALSFAWGNLTPEQSRRSVELFAGTGDAWILSCIRWRGGQ